MQGIDWIEQERFRQFALQQMGIRAWYPRRSVTGAMPARVLSDDVFGVPVQAQGVETSRAPRSAAGVGQGRALLGALTETLAEASPKHAVVVPEVIAAPHSSSSPLPSAAVFQDKYVAPFRALLLTFDGGVAFAELDEAFNEQWQQHILHQILQSTGFKWHKRQPVCVRWPVFRGAHHHWQDLSHLAACLDYMTGNAWSAARTYMIFGPSLCEVIKSLRIEDSRIFSTQMRLGELMSVPTAKSSLWQQVRTFARLGSREDVLCAR